MQTKSNIPHDPGIYRHILMTNKKPCNTHLLVTNYMKMGHAAQKNRSTERFSFNRSDVIRTRGPYLPKIVLYQLSHTPTTFSII